MDKPVASRDNTSIANDGITADSASDEFEIGDPASCLTTSYPPSICCLQLDVAVKNVNPCCELECRPRDAREGCSTLPNAEVEHECYIPLTK